MVGHVDPVAEQGTAFLLLDNTGWSETERSRGASGKWDMVELVYKVTGTNFTAETAGTITLDRVRSRDGDEAPQLAANVGAGTYTILAPPEPAERDTATREAILAYVTEHPGSTTAEVAKGVEIRRDRCRSHLGTLKTPGTGYGTVDERQSQYRDRGGRTRTRTGWYPAQTSQLTTVPDDGTGKDPHHARLMAVPRSPVSIDGTGTPADLQQRIRTIAAMPNESDQDAAFAALEATTGSHP